MKYILLILIVFSSVYALAEEMPTYSLKWEDAQVNIKDLASKCEKSSNIQTMQSSSGGSEDNVFRVRCNIQLPIDKIQAVNKFPDEIIDNGTKLQLNYSANHGAFSHTLHVTLVAMEGFKSSSSAPIRQGVIVTIPKNLNVTERVKLADDSVKIIAQEITKVLSRNEGIIEGKKINNALGVNDNGNPRILLPVSQEVLLEIIRKYPTSYGLKRPVNFDWD